MNAFHSRLDALHDALDRLRRAAPADPAAQAAFAGAFADAIAAADQVRVAGERSREHLDDVDEARAGAGADAGVPRLKAILDTAVDAIITIDEDGTIESVNQATQRLFGYVADELLGRNVSMLMPPPWRAEHDGYLERYRGTGEKRIIGIGREVEARRKDGTVFPIDLAVSEFHLGGRRLFTGMIRDITDRRWAAEELRKYAGELEQSNRELEQFASVASHDLQEPLRKIRAFGDRLLEGHTDQLDEPGRDYLRRMRNAAERMQALIDDVLAYSRVSSNAQAYERIDLTAVAHGVVSDLEVRIQETAATVDIGALPEIEADAAQMRQMLQNLIANALKFHRRGVPPVVRVRGERLPDVRGGSEHWRVTVADNGIGFEIRYLDRIFAVFQRLHGRQEYAGSGIGLAVVRKIVERHGGSITASSKPGEGSTFMVDLPARQTRQHVPTGRTATGGADR
ncbi:MAG: PAS domain S-box protein [Planctomycetota bacterium]